MTWLFWVFSAVAFAVGYRLSYKLLSDKLPPLLSVSIVMFIVSMLSFTLYYWQSSGETPAPEANLWPLITVGVIVAGLEVSIMMIYRAGGPVSIAQSLASNVISLLVLFFGIFYFAEELNSGQTFGFWLALIGVSLMTFFSHRKPR